MACCLLPGEGKALPVLERPPGKNPVALFPGALGLLASVSCASCGSVTGVQVLPWSAENAQSVLKSLLVMPSPNPEAVLPCGVLIPSLYRSLPLQNSIHVIFLA